MHGRLPVAMKNLTITLDAGLKRSIGRLARTTGRTRSQVVREALERHVWLLENAAAIAEHNRRVVKKGTFSGRLRRSS